MFGGKLDRSEPHEPHPARLRKPGVPFALIFSQWKNLWAMEASLGPNLSPFSWTLGLPYMYSHLWMVAKSVFLLGAEGWNLLFHYLADAIPVKVLFRSVSELFK